MKRSSAVSNLHLGLSEKETIVLWKKPAAKLAGCHARHATSRRNGKNQLFMVISGAASADVRRKVVNQSFSVKRHHLTGLPELDPTDVTTLLKGTSKITIQMTIV